jgi:hypothetical protein
MSLAAQISNDGCRTSALVVMSAGPQVAIDSNRASWAQTSWFPQIDIVIRTRRRPWGWPMAPTLFVSFIGVRSPLWPRARRRFYDWLGSLPSTDTHDGSSWCCCGAGLEKLPSPDIAVVADAWHCSSINVTLHNDYSSRTTCRLISMGKQQHQSKRYMDRFITFYLLEFLLHTMHINLVTRA